MGELLLCSSELASVPYYVESGSLNVYSLEELCCYMQLNIDLIEPSFMDEELICWLKKELKLETLSSQLKKILSEGGSLTEFVTALVSACSYCTREELYVMQEKLQEFENKSETECQKIRADRFLEKGRYYMSQTAYQKLLESPEVSGLLEGNIYHNLGTAYARQFLFEEAAKCYKKAYEKNQNPASKQAKEAAEQLAAGKLPQAQEEHISNFEMPQTVIETWKDTYRKSRR